MVFEFHSVANTWQQFVVDTLVVVVVVECRCSVVVVEAAVIVVLEHFAAELCIVVTLV